MALEKEVKGFEHYNPDDPSMKTKALMQSVSNHSVHVLKLVLCICSNVYDMLDSLNPLTLVSNSPYCLPYSSCDVSLENLVLNQPIIS